MPPTEPCHAGEARAWATERSALGLALPVWFLLGSSGADVAEHLALAEQPRAEAPSRTRNTHRAPRLRHDRARPWRSGDCRARWCRADGRSGGPGRADHDADGDP